MSWLDRFRRRASPPTITVTRGEDIALFAGSEGPALQMALARHGWNSRLFTGPAPTLGDGLARNLPIALVVRAGVDAGAVWEVTQRTDALTDLPLIVCGDAAAPPEALRVPHDGLEALVQALDALRGS